MTVMSEGLLLNSKYVIMGRKEGSFQAFLAQLPLAIVCHEVYRLSNLGPGSEVGGKGKKRGQALYFSG